MYFFELFLENLKKIPDFVSAPKVGEFGKLTVGKAPTAIVVFDVGIPSDADDAENGSGKVKKAPFTASVFVFSDRHRSQYESDIEAMKLALSVIKKFSNPDDEYLLEINGAEEYGFWEFRNWEFVERSATGSVLSVDFEISAYL